MTRVCFVIQDPALPSSRVRVLDLLPELHAHGLTAEVVPYPRKIRSRLRFFRACREFDAIVLQKKLVTWLDLSLLRRFAKRLLYDFDDAVYLRDTLDGDSYSRVRQRRFRNIVAAADRVIAGNRILAEQARRWNPEVNLVPSAVETRDIPVRRHGIPSERTVIGWVGSAPNLRHLAAVGPALRRLAACRPIELRVLGNRDPEIPDLPVKFIRWQRETEAAEISEFDIGIMPLVPTPFAEGKCGYKAIQYMAAGVPAVVSDVGVNADIVRDGCDGLVAPTCDAFFDALLQLIDDPARRDHMGQQARTRVEQEFSIVTVAARLATAVKQTTQS